MVQQFGMYLVLDNPVAGFGETALAAANEGVYIIQLRLDGVAAGERMKTAETVLGAIEDTDTLLVLHGDIETARDAGLDGVHIPAGGPGVDDVLDIWDDDDIIIGLTARGYGGERHLIGQEPDYVFVGPLLPESAEDKETVISLDQLEIIVDQTDIPIVAYGGITTANIREILDSGVTNYAVCRTICDSGDPARDIRRFKAIEREYLAF